MLRQIPPPRSEAEHQGMGILKLASELFGSMWLVVPGNRMGPRLHPCVCFCSYDSTTSSYREQFVLFRCCSIHKQTTLSEG